MIHPPLNKGESFLGNVEGDCVPKKYKHIVGLRVVKPAYDLHGNILSDCSALVANRKGSHEYNLYMENLLRGIRVGIK
jgi:hypothetical protein